MTKKDGKDFLMYFIIALVITIPIKIFIAQPFLVSGNSMVPTFENGEYLVVDQISYRFDEPARGDVIIFKYPLDTSKFFIKRIVGLPNETVEIRNNTVTIIKSDGTEIVLDEPYVTHEGSDLIDEKLGSDSYFVMGDNRRASSDSRIWGPVSRDLVVGKVFIRLLPVSEIGLNPGEVLQ